MKKRTNSTEIVAGFEQKIQELMEKMREVSEVPLKGSADGLEDLDLGLQKLTNELSDYISAKKLQELLFSEDLIQAAVELIKGLPQKFKNYGFCETPVRMSNGTVVTVLTPYFARPCHEKKTKKRGKGCYPGLILLGVLDHCMPRLASDVSMLSAALASLKEAQNMLMARGCKLDIKTIRNIVKRYAARARACQENGEFLQDMLLDVAGRRVAISMDGGRIRIRSNKKGPCTKKGRKRFRTDWREPKLFIIYLLDDEGEMERKYCPVIDASLHGPDSIFALLEFYLSKMNIGMAASISFIADGAPWIWERVCTSLSRVGVKLGRCNFVLDFYHAVEHLSKLLELKKWPSADRKSYLKKYRRMLLNGKMELFFEFIESLCRGSRNSAVIRERNYFLKNKEKMRYHEFASQHIPKGSGAVESAIRRVINLRLKGPGIFWHKDTANEMLLLRCYYKANRWGLLNKMACSAAISVVTG
jgi:ferredoxin-thioredoxin reductase catalytic subunit